MTLTTEKTIIDLDHDGLCESGNFYDTVASEEQVTNGLAINQAVVLRYPDESTDSGYQTENGNRIVITEKAKILQEQRLQERIEEDYKNEPKPPERIIDALRVAAATVDKSVGEMYPLANAMLVVQRRDEDSLSTNGQLYWMDVRADTVIESIDTYHGLKWLGSFQIADWMHVSPCQLIDDIGNLHVHDESHRVANVFFSQTAHGHYDVSFLGWTLLILYIRPKMKQGTGQIMAEA
ncbi:hypothetical protein [uncultured Sulfitobacter sp.]|uniref:hypothetical protein n=1 Tax=uncultured Sulfitobacter sp. TaxID=191468 RepID=UPI00261CE5E7|nr:hypothetical protein [uncultured Sulfitobacter sp.]